MKKKMNLVSLTENQLGIVKAGSEAGGLNRCASNNVECKCACPRGDCDTKLAGPNGGECGGGAV